MAGQGSRQSLFAALAFLHCPGHHPAANSCPAKTVHQLASTSAPSWVLKSTSRPSSARCCPHMSPTMRSSQHLEQTCHLICCHHSRKYLRHEEGPQTAGGVATAGINAARSQQQRCRPLLLQPWRRHPLSTQRRSPTWTRQRPLDPADGQLSRPVARSMCWRQW